MPLALFGKLPQKRDFIALDAPRSILDVFEPWLQASVATSRQAIGADWQAAYLSAPIWRFWLGAAHCGAPVLGAFMPSVDGVGRYFPLAAFTVPGSSPVPPPDIDPHDAWFVDVEALLLSALLPELAFDDLAHSLAAIPEPAAPALAPEDVGARRLQGGSLLLEDYGNGLDTVLRAVRRADHAASYMRSTVFWTVGGEAYAPAALVGERLPDASLFAAMLTGAFPGAA